MRAPPRIFSVRINLDEMFARLDALNPGDESSWLRGFRIGVRGGVLRSDDPVVTCGHEFGLHAFSAAKDFSGKQTLRANKRWKPSIPDECHGNATAMPESCRNDAISSNPVIQISNEPVIQESSNPVPTSAKPRKVKRVAEPTPLAALEVQGARMFGPANRAAWKLLITERGIDLITTTVVNLVNTGQPSTLADVVKNLHNSGLPKSQDDMMWDNFVTTKGNL